MKISQMRDRMNKLREATKKETLPQMERMLNNSKGTGTTNVLVELASRKNIPLLIENNPKTLDLLTSFHPEAKIEFYTKQLPGQPVLIDVSVIWELLRHASELKQLSTELLDWMEYKQRDW